MALPRILITGAAGNLGGKLHRHLQGRYELRLLDRDAKGDPSLQVADLANWNQDWVKQFSGVDTVFHFAADPEAYRSWPELIAPNLDALINVYEAAAQAKVRRFIFASSNHVLGGYRDDADVRLTPELPPLPGIRYAVDGVQRETFPYGSGKLFGERLGKCYADSRGMEVIAVRLGWLWRGAANVPANLPANRPEWFRSMWLSDRDFVHLMDRCLVAELPEKYVIVHGMSANKGMRWDIESTRRILGYEPKDDVTLG